MAVERANQMRVEAVEGAEGCDVGRRDRHGEPAKIVDISHYLVAFVNVLSPSVFRPDASRGALVPRRFAHGSQNSISGSGRPGGLKRVGSTERMRAANGAPNSAIEPGVVSVT